ncbi:hypothetical protein ACIRU8_39330 [Streptomyces sp. NPDC101175]|uniref:hypothetical protein n=1 Tax=Streptomyces sp. NPDC101175 TaxID=3366123 RepID=UPI00383274E6
MAVELAHRYSCTIHDGDGCDGHCAVTPELLISWYADDIAFVAEDSPAASLAEFAGQVGTAGSRMEDAGINNAEDFDTAATYLNDAVSLAGVEQAVLLKRAAGLLNNVTDMVDEYRDMV